MPLGECANRHKYNKDKYGDTCPICGLVANKAKEEDKTPEEIAEMLKLPRERYACALLVCIEGINKGRIYPIHSGKTFIGSGDDMDIQILGDDKVDRYRHAAIAYDEDINAATMLPGESSGLAYLDGSAVYLPKKLSQKAKIEVGDSKFIFLKICDDQFAWDG